MGECTPNIVFTEEYLRRISERFSKYPDDRRPFVYHLAIDDRFKDIRYKIEQLVADMPEEAQRDVIGKLRSVENCINTYHEIMVGYVLIQLGYTVEYAPSINGKTPDWCIFHPVSGKCAIIEVFTCNISDEEASTFRQLADLVVRLNKIPKGVCLGANYSRTIFLDQNRNKEIGKEVAKWLNTGVKVGDKLPVKGLNDSMLDFVVEMVDDALPHVFASPALEYAREIDPEPLRRKIRNKINDYGRIALETGIPLIIAIIPDPYTGYAVDSLEDALLGSDITQLCITTDGIVGARNMRGDDGVQADNKPLTGVIWIENDGKRGWHIEHYEKNPDASYPFDIAIN